jgi:M6 family metalloprotease-like protein
MTCIALQPIVAAPAYPHPVNYQLPDGTEITIQLMGDEWVNWAVSPDGYTLLTNKDGFWEYAIQDKSGDLKLSGIRAHNKPERKGDEQRFLERQSRDLRFSASQLATKHQSRESVSVNTDARIQRKSSSRFSGDIRIPVILVEFADRPFTQEPADFERLFNEPNLTSTFGGERVTGSLRDYFLDNSNGTMNFSADVFGPFRLPDTVGRYNWYNSSSGGSSVLMAQLAVAAAAAAGCDFSKYDANNDGIVDVVHIVFAGYGQEAGAPATHSIWSHAAQVQGSPMYNGVEVRSYSSSPELRGNSDNSMSHIGIVAHELGHGLLRLPDFYDTDYSANGQAVDMGDWCVMSGGTWNDGGRTPPLFSAYASSFVGWTPAVELTVPTDITLPNPAQERKIYRINTPEANEYYLIENRQRQGWDAGVPGSGMLIYHLDRSTSFSGGMNNRADYRGYYVKQAGCSAPDGCFNNRGTDPWPQTQIGKTEFTDETTPNSMTRTGQRTNKPITHITRNDAERTVSFKFRGGTPAAVDAALTEIVLPSKLWGEGEQNIRVKLENMGVPLTSATVLWTVNDVEQTPYQWEGNLTVDEYEVVTIGTFLFELGDTYNITAILNIDEDINPQNDTIRTTVEVSEKTPFFFEDFEGDEFEDWDLVNAIYTNKWVIGAATSASGNKSAYISNDDGVSNYYTLNAGSVVFLEAYVEFPHSEEDFDLYFDVRCVGEFVNEELDYLQVQAGESWMPRPSTARFGRFYDIPAWETKHIILPSSSFSGKRIRLIFTWNNNASNGNQPPAAVDNIAIVARSTFIPDPPDPPITEISKTTPETSSMKAWVQNGILYIDGLTVGETYRVYTIAGTLVYQGIATTNDVVVRARHASPLPNGTYIIQSENKSTKIIW